MDALLIKSAWDAMDPDLVRKVAHRICSVANRSCLCAKAKKPQHCDALESSARSIILLVLLEGSK